MLRRGIWFAGDVPTDRMVELARKAERSGVDSVWMADGYYARDPLVSLAAIGSATERVMLGTSVLNPFTRHPAALAMAFATLDELSGGRAVIGIGAGARHQVEGQMGYDASRPMAAVREAVDVLERMATGEEVDYDGKVVTARGARLLIRGARPLPIYVGAVGPKMLQLAGERGAGAFVPQTSPAFVRSAVEEVAKGAAAAGRDPRDVDIAALIILAVAEDVEAAQRSVGALLGILMLAPEGDRILEGNGLDPAIADRLRAAYATGGVRKVAQNVTPEMIDKLTIAGPPDLCRDKLQALVDAGVTHPVISMLGRSSEEGLEVLNAIEDPKMTPRPAETFDYVIVGGGTAGCVLATRLSEDPRVSVLLIEAGGDERRHDIETPDAWPTLLGSDVDWSFETGVQPATGRAFPAARGRVLGGSGSINNMVHLRGHAADFDEWASAGGARGWDYRGVLPYFMRSEDVPQGNPLYRGRGGPLQPRPFGTWDPVGIRFAEGAKRAGHMPVTDFNAGSMLGIGFPDALIVRGRRESTASAYLRPAMARPNLTVQQETLVRRIVVEHGRCAGVEYVREGVTSLARAAEDVVLCAGAVGSPHLLLLSGIGPADELAALGIAAVVDAPEVGRNLQDHLLLAGIRYQAERPLPPECMMASATLLARSEAGTRGPDLHATVVNADYHQEWQEPLPNSFTFVIGHMRAQSRGTVTLASADPGVPPVIDPRYLSEAYDVDQLIRGIEMVDEAVETGVFDDWGGRSQTSAMLQLDRGDLVRLVHDGASSYFHLAGTCRMGSDMGAVVDPRLQVRGVDGLRVADASVMPTQVSCNSNAATIMIGEKAADLLRGLEVREDSADVEYDGR